ncbi:MAG: chromosomal replication initiator protein DnaA [Hyphococcus sp.]|nr:MAG: chromosomal replication initiator protein DnaA [Marinicaulis sp.]
MTISSDEGGGNSNEHGAAFNRYLEALRGRVGDAKYRSWFLDLGLAEMARGTVILSTGSEAKRDMLDHRFLPVLMETWRAEIGPVEQFKLTVRKTLRAQAAKINAREKQRASGASNAADFSASPKHEQAMSTIGAPLDPRRTFDAYAVGDSNRIARAAARQALIKSGPRELVYIYGESGLGKTHLLHAVSHEWNKDADRGDSIYVTYRNLINACVGAVMSNSTQEFHRTLMQNSLFAFDDIHLLQGKARTQEELLIVIDAALDSGKQVVIAGELPPSKLAESGIQKRLADRLAGGLCAPVHMADETLRLDILKKRVLSSEAQCRITDEVLEFISRTFTQSTRETIGALNQLLLMYGDEATVVDMDEAKTILRSRLEDRRKFVTLDDAIAAGAEAFGLKLEDMTCRSQPQRIVRARHAVVWCAREVLKESFPRIGKALKRDHTTVMSSYRRAQALLERDKAFQDGVKRIREALED